jgi:hypothetical protein
LIYLGVPLLSLSLSPPSLSFSLSKIDLRQKDKGSAAVIMAASEVTMINFSLTVLSFYWQFTIFCEDNFLENVMARNPLSAFSKL